MKYYAIMKNYEIFIRKRSSSFTTFFLRVFMKLNNLEEFSYFSIITLKEGITLVHA